MTKITNVLNFRSFRRPLYQGVAMILALGMSAGCQSTNGNVGRLQSYSFSEVEAAWIRNGDPIEFEGDPWYPSDNIESFQDSEMSLLGVYQGVQFFADKADVRPYARLYTKFDRNKFRFFQKRPGNDPR